MPLSTTAWRTRSLVMPAMNSSKDPAAMIILAWSTPSMRSVWISSTSSQSLSTKSSLTQPTVSSPAAGCPLACAPWATMSSQPLSGGLASMTALALAPWLIWRTSSSTSARRVISPWYVV